MVAMVMKCHSHWDSQFMALCWHFPQCHDQGGPEKPPCFASTGKATLKHKEHREHGLYLRPMPRKAARPGQLHGFPLNDTILIYILILGYASQIS